ncbi:rhodanese-like domain-containing protein [Pseudoalteromonas 'SMAR']|uniref:rhodanese-like domain-containing protein n=1 Tax=Pseudoalteromonas 'SMAR' TaxID=3416908 RepID=UPI003AF26C0F
MKKWILFTLLIISSTAFAAKFESVSQQQLLVNQMSAEPDVIVDVRSPQEYAAGHIKGAINIPFNQLDKYQQQLQALKDKTLVVYCRSGRRAGIFIDALQPKGYSLKHLEGDMNGWQAESLPVIREDNK